MFLSFSFSSIIFNKADHTKDNMGLTTWKNSPDGRILKSDVSIAKNYLAEKEIRQLERAVTGFFRSGLRPIRQRPRPSFECQPIRHGPTNVGKSVKNKET